MRKLLVVLVVVALALVAAACSSGDDDSDAGEAAGVVEAEEGAGDVADGEAVPVAESSQGGSLPPVGPHVVQTASIALSVPRDEFEPTIQSARSIAAGLGGFVVSSSASQGDERRLVRGSLVVRVPERSYAQAMERLAGLGRVEGREESGQDVSQELVDLQARARHLQAVERRLLAFLDRAETVAAALAVQSELDDVQLELEQARGRLRYLEDQVAYATISLDVRERQVRAAGDDGGPWSIVAAWRAAAHGFVTVVGWILVAAATIAPVVLLLVLGLFGGRFLLRRSLPGLKRG